MARTAAAAAGRRQDLGQEWDHLELVRQVLALMSARWEWASCQAWGPVLGPKLASAPPVWALHQELALQWALARALGWSGWEPASGRSG